MHKRSVESVCVHCDYALHLIAVSDLTVELKRFFKLIRTYELSVWFLSAEVIVASAIGEYSFGTSPGLHLVSLAELYHRTISSSAM